MSLRGLWFVALVVGPFAYGLGGLDRLVSVLGLAAALHVLVAWRLSLQREAAVVAAGTGICLGLLVAFTSGHRAALLHLGVPLAFCMGFLDGFRVSAMERIREALGVSLAIVVIIAVTLAREHQPLSLFMMGLVLTGLIAALAATHARHLGRTQSRLPWKETLTRLLMAGTTCIGLFVLLADEILPLFDRSLITIGTCVFYATIFFGARMLARWLDPRLKFFGVLAAYIRAMGTPLGGFALGFGTIVVVFAGLFATMHRINPESFAGLTGAASFVDWLYFSLATATTLGYGDVAPATLLAKLIVGSEAVLATGWLVVVFGAVTAYLQPRLAKLGQLEHESAE